MPTIFLPALQDHLPADVFPWVAAALLQDPLVWEALHTGLGEQALAQSDGDPAAWSPGALARLALEHAGSSDDELPQAPRTLTQAAQQALLLQQIRQEQGHWGGLADVLSEAPHHWLTAIAIVYGWAEDRAALLHALATLPRGGTLGLHAILSQPFPPEVQAIHLADFLRVVSADQRPSLLWKLQARRPHLARQAAQNLPATGLPKPYLAWQQAAQYWVTDQTEAAQQALNLAWEETRKLTAALAAHQACLAEQMGDHTTALTAWEQAVAAEPQSAIFAARRALALHRSRRSDEARATLPEHPQHPALLAAGAQILQAVHPQTAHQYARQALEGADHLSDALLETLVAALKALGDLPAAAHAAQQLVHRRPTDLETLDEAAALAQTVESWATALEFSLLAHHVAPSAERLRRLAQAQQALEMYPQALAAWQTLTALPEATADDHLAHAELALQLGQTDEALQAAEAVLAHSPQHPLALTILGKVAAAQGEPEKARRLLEEAVQQRPSNAAPYLALAQVLAAQEGPSAALETLQTATHALPQEAEPHYQLGLYYLESHRPAHARQPLETAHRLAPQRTDIALALARVYLALGQAEEARQLLSRYHFQEQRPTPKIARLLAKAHLEAQAPQEAAAVLAPLAQRADASPEDLFTYAQALLAAHTDPDRAESALQTALQRLPDDEEHRLFRADVLAALAEAQLAQNKPEDALATYREALRLLPDGHPQRQQRLARGLAETALSLRRPEIALASLEEALQQAPQDVTLHRLQAEAYRQAGFAEQALEAARQVLALKPDDPDTALWYARLAHALGQHRLAAESLRPWLDQTAQHPQIALLLAQIYRALGEENQARAVLERLIQHADHINASECAQAGEQLLALQQPTLAATCLRRAVHHPQSPLAWHLTLVRALQAQSLWDEAIQAAQAALQQAGNAASPKEDKEHRAALYMAIVQSALAKNDLQTASQTLEEAQREANTPTLQRAALTLWRSLGNYARALDAAEQYLAEHPTDLRARARAAELAAALLDPALAQRFLQPSHTISDERNTPPVVTAYLAIAAEIALNEGREVAAAEITTTALEYLPIVDDPALHAHLAALQARLAARRGAHEEAQNFLEQALATIQPVGLTSETASAWAGLAEAALECRQWGLAQDLAQRLHQTCPHDASAALRVARFAVLTAEAQARCQAVEALRQAPGADALGEHAQEKWQQGLQGAQQALAESAISTPENHPALIRWQARGQAIFQNQVTQTLLTEPTAADVAAALGVLQRRQKPIGDLPLAHGDHPLVRFHLALVLEHAAQPDFPAAQEHAQFARQHRPHWAAAHFLTARTAYRARAYAVANEAIEAALALQPDEPRWHVWAAEIALALEQHAPAAEHLRQAIRLEPDQLAHYLRLAETYRDGGQPEQALQVLEEALQTFPTEGALHLALAQTLHRLGQLDRAAYHADKAIRANRQAEAPVLLRAQIALDQHDPATAENLMSRWLEQHPHHPDATLYLAKALQAQGRAAEALQIVEETLPFADSALPLYILRAELLKQVHGPAAAVEAWRTLLASRPEAPALWLGLAQALAEAHQSAAAQEAAHKALRRADELSPEQRIQLHLLLGSLAKERGDLDLAVHHFSEALQIAPDNLEALLKLGETQMARQLYREALEIFTQAQRLAPHDARAYYQAGLVYKNIKDYEQAEAMFRKAVQLDPNDGRAKRQLRSITVVNLLNRPTGINLL